MAAQTTPLLDRHTALGAKLTPFGGWEMPLAYPAGTLAEHKACRQDAVVFDVSHLGTVRVAGPGAFTRLQRALTNDLGRVGVGRAQYTHLLHDDGWVLDDLIVWWLDEQRFEVMPNASNTSGVLAALNSAGQEPDEIGDVTAERALLAVQGPNARERLAEVSAEAAAVGRFRVAQVGWQEAQLTVAGTGYTGEDGVEVAVPSAAAGDFWDALMDAGLVPAGLGARDTLRLEAGLPLHGHELGPGITPLQAGLGWVVAWDKPEFLGKDALEAERQQGVQRRLVGLRAEGRRPPRAGQAVLRDATPAGEVTSGNFSPTLGVGIALAFLPPDAEEGEQVRIDMRGAEVAATVVALPFV